MRAVQVKMYVASNSGAQIFFIRSKCVVNFLLFENLFYKTFSEKLSEKKVLVFLSNEQECKI